MTRITEFDGIRALAILAVVGCHYYPFTTMFFELPEFGWVGVDIFFVLSGFLITTILLRLKGSQHPYQVFYIRRILRIFPPYYAVVTLVLAISLLRGESLHWTHAVGYVFFLQSFSREASVFQHIGQAIHHPALVQLPFGHVALPPTFDRFPTTSLSASLGPTWSLSIEEWFYILWAPMVLHFRRRTLWLACVIACAAGPLVRYLGFLGIHSYFDFCSRIDILLAGALLALWIERRSTLPTAVRKYWDSMVLAAAVASMALIALILASIRPVLGYEIRESILFSSLGLSLLGIACAGFLSYILRIANTARPLSRFLRLKPLVWLGKISFTFYLLHVPIYVLISDAAQALGFPLASYTPALLISLLSLVISLCVAHLSFRFFETPVLAYKDKLTERIVREKPSKYQMAN